MWENLAKINNQNGETLSNDKLRQAVSDVREETDAEHGRNINDITCGDSYQSTTKKKDVSTINDCIYHVLESLIMSICSSNS